MKKLDVVICKQLREEGKTYKEIADYFKVSKQAVFDLLDKAGMPRKTKYSQYYAEWENLYKQGISTNRIAEKYGCPDETVRLHLSKKLIIEPGKIVRERGKKPASEVVSTGERAL